MKHEYQGKYRKMMPIDIFVKPILQNEIIPAPGVGGRGCSGRGFGRGAGAGGTPVPGRPPGDIPVEPGSLKKEVH